MDEEQPPGRQPPDASGARDDKDAIGSRSGKRRRWWLIGGLGAVLLLAGAIGLGWYWFAVLRHLESTNDAYLQADVVTIGPHVGGYVAELAVTDNQPVEAGDVLLRIDDRDYRTAVAQREAAVAQARAQLADAEAQIDLQQAKIDQAQTQVTAAEGALGFAQDEQRRYQQLEASGNGTVQRAQQTSANLTQRQASLASARAAVTAARRQLEVLEAQRQAAAAGVQASEAQLAQARSNLGYTVLTAPIDGAVGDRSVELGEYVQPGARLMSIVPMGRRIYLIANFKETQLDRMARGQRVEVTVDTFPDSIFRGKVDSLAPGTGSQFALLPPENATGNFTKIVQRVPVKITLEDDAGNLGRLRPGLSAEATVDLRTTPSGPVSTLAEPAS